MKTPVLIFALAVGVPLWAGFLWFFFGSWLKRPWLKRRLRRLTKEKQRLLWDIQERTYAFRDMPPRSQEAAVNQRIITALEEKLAANSAKIKEIGRQVRQL